MTMEAKTTQGSTDTDILFSRTVKAGQRIYYLDVKKNRRGDKYLSITESKKTFSGTQEDQHVNYEKHKIFLFAEDFQKFQECLAEAMEYAQTGQGETTERHESGDIHISMDFPPEL